MHIDIEEMTDAIVKSQNKHEEVVTILNSLKWEDEVHDSYQTFSRQCSSYEQEIGISKNKLETISMELQRILESSQIQNRIKMLRVQYNLIIV